MKTILVPLALMAGALGAPRAGDCAPPPSPQVAPPEAAADRYDPSPVVRMGVEEAVQLDAEALAREALAPPPPQPDPRSVLLDTVQRLRRVLTEHEAVVVGELGPIRTVVRRDPREATSDTWRIADLRVDAVIRQRAGSPVPPVIHLEWFESAHTFEPRPDHRRYVLTVQQRADGTWRPRAEADDTLSWPLDTKDRVVGTELSVGDIGLALREGAR